MNLQQLEYFKVIEITLIVWKGNSVSCLYKLKRNEIYQMKEAKI